MKKILVGILIMILVAPFAMKCYIYADYHTSLDSIIKELCVNKDKPEMQCNGKCYLNKQIAIVDGIDADSEKVPLPSSPSQEKQDVSLFFLTVNNFYSIEDLFFTYNNLESLYLINYEHLSTSSLFIPPKIQNA